MTVRVPAAVVFQRVHAVERAKRFRCVYFIAGDREACGVERRVLGVRRRCRVGYVGAGLNAMAIVRKRSASGQAEAKATRMRVAVSMTRAATLRSRKRNVAN